MNREKFKRMLLIYFGGYATHKPYTLDEWFEARDYVNAHPTWMPKIN